MSTMYTYSDPVLSLWQAAVAEVQRRHQSMQNRMGLTGTEAAPPKLLPEENLMAPALLLGADLKSGKPVPAPALDMAARAELIGTVVDCAKTAAEFLAAEITGNHQQSEILAGELKDSQCDVLGWSECLTTYLAYKASLSSLPYRPNLNPVMDLGQRTKLAIIGDWGTGDAVAINLLQQVASFGPEVLIHLGDVYYAGTHNEEQTNFLDLCRQILGDDVLIFSLCGNHDMYSGGQGYYWLVDQIGQQASYFCLENSNWQFLAMDTGHNDNNPITVSSNMTKLVNFGTWAEENWILDKINLAGPNQKTVLLSHHQLFSPFGSVGTIEGTAYAYNKNLRATFQGVMSKIACWFWGHEHTLAIFDPYMDLKRGRCVGASAVPVFLDQQSYKNDNGLETYGSLPLPTWKTNCQLGSTEGAYNNCFAMMTLNGASATVDYYQVPLMKSAVKFPFSDNF